MAAKATKAGSATEAGTAGSATKAGTAGSAGPAARPEDADETPSAASVAKKGTPVAKKNPPTVKKAAPAAEKATPAAKAVRPQPAPAAPATGDGGDSAEAEEFVPMNRAERRAKARGKSIAPPPSGRGKVSGSHGPAHTFRNWANRRTG